MTIYMPEANLQEVFDKVISKKLEQEKTIKETFKDNDTFVTDFNTAESHIAVLSSELSKEFSKHLKKPNFIQKLVGRGNIYNTLLTEVLSGYYAKADSLPEEVGTLATKIDESNGSGYNKDGKVPNDKQHELLISQRLTKKNKLEDIKEYSILNIIAEEFANFCENQFAENKIDENKEAVTYIEKVLKEERDAYKGKLNIQD